LSDILLIQRFIILPAHSVDMGKGNLRGQFEPTPAIVRDYSPEDANTTIVNQPKDTVTFRRGWGDSGYRIQTVEHECPECGFDRMVRRVDVSPERSDEVRYWCLNPNCVHFVRDNLSHATAGNYPQRDTDEPAVFEEADA
jgi:predicted RNA-binding Zn-ribbon protein involved in translation (DUF1610 family)